MIKNLKMSLKRKWFEMTGPDGKPEDYRELTEYWTKRLCEPTDEDVSISDVMYYLNGGKKDPLVSNMFKFKDFKYNIMTLGYPSKDQKNRFKIFEHAGIEVRTGNPEWGAEPGKLYFVIKHGKIIDND